MPRRVLVIDDSPIIVAVVQKTLLDAGYEVSVATTLEAFEEERRVHPPDLIVADVQMPEIFGDDLASTLQGAYAEPAPIVLLSSLPDDELERRASEANVRGWVSKMAGMPALVAKIREIFGETERTHPAG